MSNPAPGWIRRHPVAFSVLLVLGLVWGLCGFVGALALVMPTDEEPTAADETSGAPDPADVPSSEEPQDVLATSGSPGPEPSTGAEPPVTYLVARVVDGDTIELDNGDDVRLVGIDAPEEGTCGAARATEKLVALVEGRRVLLERAGDDRDRYDRLLRYVDRGTVDAGLAMIESGLAIARYDSRDGYGEHPRETSYVKADRRSPDVTCAPPPKPPKQLVDPPPNCEPGYSPCVPSYPPDLDCADTGPVTVTGSDPHGLDGDGDGVACGAD